MKAKAISVKQYLELLKVGKVSRSRGYALVNQDVRGGTVYFSDRRATESVERPLTSI